MRYPGFYQANIMWTSSFLLAFLVSILSFSFSDGVLQDTDYMAEDAKLAVKIHPELCGNGRKDPGEECDCGPAEKCRHDPCCHSTCQLKLHSQCSNNEPCCEKCKFKTVGTVCKAARHSCDIVQYCDGISGACPSGTFKRNGINCTDEHSANGVCFNGICKSFHQPCEEVLKKLETEPIKEKSKCVGNSVCINQTCVKLRDIPNARECPHDSSGKECSFPNGECNNLHQCFCKPGWTGSTCLVKQDIHSLHRNDDKPGIVRGVGPDQKDSTSNTPLLVGMLVLFVVVVSVIFVVMAFRFIPTKTPKDNNATMYPHAQLETVDSDGPNAANQMPTT